MIQFSVAVTGMRGSEEDDIERPTGSAPIRSSKIPPDTVASLVGTPSVGR
jgi:hypothetical protein